MFAQRYCALQVAGTKPPVVTGRRRAYEAQTELTYINDSGLDHLCEEQVSSCSASDDSDHNGIRSGKRIESLTYVWRMFGLLVGSRAGGFLGRHDD